MRQFSIGQKVMFEDKWGRLNDGIISELNKPFPTVNDDGDVVDMYLTVVQSDMGLGGEPSNVAISNEQIFCNVLLWPGALSARGIKGDSWEEE